MVEYPKTRALILYFSSSFLLHYSLIHYFVCCIILHILLQWQNSQQGIRALRTGDVQSILKGESENDSQCSLPQVPNETIDATGLSGVRQNLSSSFSHFRRGLASAISRQPAQTQNPVSKDVNADQLSPISLQTQLTAYQATVRDLHEQNNRNAELPRSSRNNGYG